MTTLEIDMGAAMVLARESGAGGWSAASMLAALSSGMLAAAETRQADDVSGDRDRANG
jgi:hypothetical protein